MNTESQLEPAHPPAGHDRSTQSSGSALPYFLCLVVVFAIAYGGWKWWQVSQFDLARSQAIQANEVGPPLTEFELAERGGKPFRSADMRGKVWVASYFFSSCAGTCARVATSIQLQQNLPDVKDVTWVSITCDPDNDTLDVLRSHADRLGADPSRWLFCRADLDYTKRVALGMKVHLSYKAHQDHIIVIDKAGKVRGYFDGTSTDDCKKMHNLLLKCLAEKPPSDMVASRTANGKPS